MANQIALNFGERRDPRMASRKTEEHLEKFWTRGMREQLAKHVASGAEDVSPAVLSALGNEILSGR
jgi:formate dehydrogenase subunit delta